MSYQDFIVSSALKTFAINKITPMKSEMYNSFFADFDNIKTFEPTNMFLEFISFSLEAYYDSDIHSEIWLRTHMISPFLIEMARKYKSLFIWEGIRLDADRDKGLTGEPDYFVTKKSGSPEVPYCIVGEAKKDNFERGWGQCLAGMIGAQILNNTKSMSIPIYGIVTSGIDWEFGKLRGKDFSIYPNEKLSVFKEDDRNQILGILDVIFSKCEEYIK